jgi:SAM-dependent methyltransferase
MNAMKNPVHYFSVGASAIHLIRANLILAKLSSPKSILDFACGAGRVTRWLRAAFPAAEISCADVREIDLAFLEAAFKVRTWRSASSFDNLVAPTSFDLIWVGSLLTHLSESDSRIIISKFMNWLQPNGLLIFTFHGRRVLLGKTLRNAKYISDSKFVIAKDSYLRTGYGYQDYDDQKGLGFSLTKPGWIFDIAAEHDNWTVLGTYERAWDDHHDACAILNAPICIPI